MHNYNQYYQGQNQTGIPAFAGPQALFQPGFAGTNAQQVRQNIANQVGFGGQSGFGQPQFGGGNFSAQQAGGFAGAAGATGATGAQAIFQPGFAGTNAQQVRQDIANEVGFAGQGGYMQSQMGGGNFSAQQAGGFAGAAGATGGQAIFQPGFAGTNAQQVRQNIANQVGFAGQGGYMQSQMGGGNFSAQQAGGFAGAAGATGAQAIFQPGFAGTNAQQVRQDIANEVGFAGQGGYMQSQMGGGNFSAQQAGGFAGATGATGAQAIFQPGFAGTNAQQVRQDIANEVGFAGQGGYMQSQMGGGNFSAQQAGGFAGAAGATGGQAIFQPGFAGTNAQQVRQNIANQVGFAGQGGYMQSQMGGGNFSAQQAGGFAGAAGATGGQAIFQPGFAGTNAQQVRQDIANEVGFAGQGGFTQ